ncbi:MAG: 30S ribosomal protein S2 [Patescibacteria group bacterium]
MENTHIPPYEDMIKAGMHFGRKKTIFHPNMKSFVYTAKEHIYLLDLIRTSETLIKAIDVMRQALTEGKTILFVGVTKPSGEPVKSTAVALGMPYVTERWLGGTLTNFKVIIARVKHLEDLEREQLSGGFDKYTKKERLLKEREIEALKKKYDGLRKLTKLPDLVFVSSLKESQLAVKEAIVTKIPTVGIVNTDSDPKQLTYPIPANDNAKKSVELILETIKQSCQSMLSKNSEN